MRALGGIQGQENLSYWPLCDISGYLASGRPSYTFLVRCFETDLWAGSRDWATVSRIQDTCFSRQQV